jgi:hypothetical protein
MVVTRKSTLQQLPATMKKHVLLKAKLVMTKKLKPLMATVSFTKLTTTMTLKKMTKMLKLTTRQKKLAKI